MADLYRLSGKKTYKSKKEKEREEAQKKLVKQRQETRKVNAEKGTSVVRRTTNQAIEYTQKGYTGKSGDPKTKSYKWETDNLYDLPRSYGRSYNDKFDTWTRSEGMSRQEANEFRTWLDSKEDVTKTRKKSNQKGYKEIPIRSRNSELQEMLDSKEKAGMSRTKRLNETSLKNKAAEEKEKAEKDAAAKKKKETERDGLLGFLDKTAGRTSRKMSEILLGEKFVNTQDEVYKKNAKARKDDESLKMTNVASREAQGTLEKAADIAGIGAGVAGYLAPGVGSYKAAGAIGNLAKMTKGGSQVASKLASKPYATELVRGGTAGAIFGSGNQAAREAIDPEEFNGADHWKRIAFDTVAGGVGDAAIRGIGQGFNALRNTRADKLNVNSGAYGAVKDSLPSYTGQPGEDALKAITPPRTGEATKELVNNSVSRVSQGQQQLDNVLNQMRAARQPGANSPMPAQHFEKQLDNSMAKSREEAIQTQFEYLKQNMTKGKYGGTTTNTFGEIDGTFTVSNNEGWYQEVYKQNGNRPPSQKQLKELAVKHVDDGFIDAVGEIPAWRPPQFDDLEQQIAQYTKMIASNPEDTPVILPLLQAAEQDLTALISSYNKVKPQPKPHYEDPEEVVTVQSVNQAPTNQAPTNEAAFNDVMNDISSLRGSVDNQRQNIENMSIPSQTAPEVDLRAFDSPEGILSQSTPNASNTKPQAAIKPASEVRKTVSDDLVPVPTTKEEYEHNIKRLEEYVQKIEAEKAAKRTKKERDAVDRVIKRVNGSVETNKKGLEALQQPKAADVPKKGRPKQKATSKLSDLERNETPLDKASRLLDDAKAKHAANPTPATKAKLDAMETAYKRQTKSREIDNSPNAKNQSTEAVNPTKPKRDYVAENNRRWSEAKDFYEGRKSADSSPSASFKTDMYNIVAKVTKGHPNEQQMIDRLKSEGYKYNKSEGVWKKPNNLKQRGKMQDIVKELGGKIEQKEVKFMKNSAPVRQPNPDAKVKPITERELKESLIKEFDIPIRSGKMNTPGDIQGLYKTRSHEIRTQKHNDLPVMAHEIGHHLDNQFNLTRNIPVQQRDELLELGARTSDSSYSDKEVIEEGLAEFIRLKLTNDDLARKLAPEFYKSFANRLDKNTTKSFANAKATIDRWIDQGTVNQLKGKIDTKGNVESAQSVVSKGYEELIDSNHLLKKMELDLDGQQMFSIFGKNKMDLNKADKSIYKAAQLSAGAPKIAELHLKNALIPIFKNAKKDGISIENLRAYSTAKHAETLEFMGINAGKAALEDAKAIRKGKDLEDRVKEFGNNYGITISKAQIESVKKGNALTLTTDQLRKIVKENHIESGMTQKQIRDTLRGLDSPEMAKHHKEIVKYNDDLLKKLVDAGFVKKEAYNAMRSRYPDYIPFNRFFDEDLTNAFTGSTNGFVDVTNPIKKLKGSTRNVVDPFESMIKNTFNVINKIEKNKVGQQLARLTEIEGSAKWAVKLDGSTADSKENIVTVWRNGEKEQFQVHKDVYGVLKGLDENGANIIMTALSKPTGWLRAGATLTPEFMLRNPIRDQVSAFTNSDSGYNPLIDLPLGMMSVISGKMKLNNKMAKEYYQWVNEGGAFGGYLSQDRNYLQETLRQVKSKGAFKNGANLITNPKAWASASLKAFTNGVDTMMKPLQLGSELMEEATKMGEFKKAIRKGETPREAAFRARDLMDFARSGNSIKQANKIVPFLNANIQGKDKLARSFMKHPIRTTTRALTAVTLPTVGAYMAMEHLANDAQKEKWADVPQWQKDTHWIVPIPFSDELGRIPKPFDLAPLFANPVELTMDYMKENDPESWKSFVARNTTSLVSLPLTMAALSPTIENLTNYDFFTKSSVVPAYQADDLPEDQYGPNTSFVARLGGKATGTSPYKWDNFITGHFAGLGQYALDGIDVAANSSVGRKAASKMGIEMPTAPSKKWTEYPVVKALTVSTKGGGQSTTDFYDKFDSLKKEKLRSEKNGTSYNESDYEKMAESNKEVNEIRKEYKAIQNDTKMDSKTKRNQLDRLDEEMSRIMKYTLREVK